MSANFVAEWDGQAWSALGSGFDQDVRVLGVFDDSTGPALYAGGGFTTAGDVTVNRIAKWDGASWSALGSGIGGSASSAEVRALALFDDGSGPALYAGGQLGYNGGGGPAVPERLRKWDGATWMFAGDEFDGTIQALAIFDDGSGPALYVGGSFTRVGQIAADGIARWDGTTWSGLAVGSIGAVQVLATFDDGNGPALHAGGALGGVAKWDGSSWSLLGVGMNDQVLALAAFDDGSGSELFAGGTFTSADGVAANRIAKWDGASWTALESGIGSPLPFPRVAALAAFDDGSGPALCVLGNFGAAGGLSVNHVARWSGDWSLLDVAPDNELSSSVQALSVFDSGAGPRLHAGGVFGVAGGAVANSVASWDGQSWSPLGVGVNGWVHALEVFDDESGGGPALHAAGNFTTAGGAAANHVARWDGTSWSPLGSGLSGSFLGPTTVFALEVFDDGSGPALHAGGNFTNAGGPLAAGVAKWDGLSWSPLRLGLLGEVTALAVFDDGSGPALYAGGGFQQTGGGGSAHHIARWDGTRWWPLGAGTNGSVHALAVFDDGGGPALYAGGRFSSAGGVPAPGLAKWDGTGWSSLASALEGPDPLVYSLATFDDGSGESLYAGGYFDLAGGPGPGSYLAEWDGTDWSPVGGGVEGAVLAITTFDHPSGRALYLGGSFTRAVDAGDPYLARWQGCLDVVPPAIHCPAGVFVHERPGGPAGETVVFSVTASDEVDPAPTVVCVPPSGSVFPPGGTTVVCTATDAAGNQATCEFRVTVGNKVR